MTILLYLFLSPGGGPGYPDPSWSPWAYYSLTSVPATSNGTTWEIGRLGLLSESPSLRLCTQSLGEGDSSSSRCPWGRLRRWPEPGCSVHSSRAPCLSATGACARASRTQPGAARSPFLFPPNKLTWLCPPSLSGNVMNGMYKSQPVSSRPGMQALATSPPRAAL